MSKSFKGSTCETTRANQILKNLLSYIRWEFRERAIFMYVLLRKDWLQWIDHQKNYRESGGKGNSGAPRWFCGCTSPTVMDMLLLLLNGNSEQQKDKKMKIWTIWSCHPCNLCGKVLYCSTSTRFRKHALIKTLQQQQKTNVVHPIYKLNYNQKWSYTETYFNTIKWSLAAPKWNGE